jgi:hypothetical protein
VKHLLNAIVRVGIWHDPLIGEKMFLGQMNLSIGSITIGNSIWSHDGWYYLCPRPVTPTQSSRLDIGSLRVEIKYSKDVIYPLRVYDALCQMLLETTVSAVSVNCTGLTCLLCDTAVCVLCRRDCVILLYSCWEKYIGIGRL